MAEHVAHMRKMCKAYIFKRKPRGMRLPRKPRQRWEDNIKIYLKETANNMFSSIILVQLLKERILRSNKKEIPQLTMEAIFHVISAYLRNSWVC